ncbi:DUF222 domain-containing protein [Mycobacterium sp. 1274756.6]|uniref:DUF222 domain-containing protein n=1 Tax=Mycobacterium sp. 1274756.6 TaxID=1834076 RepID=UPI0007FD6530|nr:DUF222 domain-containing protein [Mycobacterium sp. 1274756.6]OBJ70976.1 hypothetical protein A5643_08770 [Mycobacterium sp. 1274756.6]
MDSVATSELGALDTAVAELADLDIAALTPAARLDVLEKLETALRRQVAISHRVANSIAAEGADRLGDMPHKAIADRLRISYAEARRRIRDAAQLTPRTSLTGDEYVVMVLISLSFCVSRN